MLKPRTPCRPQDSLWYSEDLAAVPDRDAGRVCILQGPVAVAHSTVADEPAADILSGVHDGLVAALAGAAAPPPVDVRCIGGVYEAAAAAAAADAPAPWLAALLHSPSLVLFEAPSTPARAWRLAPNPWPRILAPSAGWEVRVVPGPGPAAAAIHLVPAGTPQAADAAALAAAARVSAEHDPAAGEVRLSVRDDVPGGAAPLLLRLRLRLLPGAAGSPLAMEGAEWEAAVRAHYRALWFCEDDAAPAADALAPLETSAELSEDALRRFALATQQPLHVAGGGGGGSGLALAPASYSVVACWRALIGCLFAGSVRGDLLSLVHLSHECALPGGGGDDAEGGEAGPTSVWPRAGDTVSSRLLVTEVAILPSGNQRVTVAGSLLCAAPAAPAAPQQQQQQHWVDVRSSFLFRGAFSDFGAAFRRSPPAGESFVLRLASAADVAVLCSKAWFRRALLPVPPSQAAWALDQTGGASSDAPPTHDADAPPPAAAPIELAVGDVLAFRLHIVERPADAHSLARVSVRGSVRRVIAARKAAASAANGPRPTATRGRATLAPAKALAGGQRHTLRTSASVASFISMRSALTEGGDLAAAPAAATPDAAGPAGGVCDVGSVEFEWPPAHTAGGEGDAPPPPLKSNPVTAFLRRAAAAEAEVVPLPGGPRPLLAAPDVATAPPSNVPYATASLDLNPIHRDAVVAALAGLPGTITHGMWTSANGLRVLLGLVDAELAGAGGAAGAAPAATPSGVAGSPAAQARREVAAALRATTSQRAPPPLAGPRPPLRRRVRRDGPAGGPPRDAGQPRWHARAVGQPRPRRRDLRHAPAR